MGEAKRVDFVVVASRYRFARNRNIKFADKKVTSSTSYLYRTAWFYATFAATQWTRRWSCC